MIIYLDLIICLNLICNGMILLLTRKLSRIATSTSRIIFGTIIATLIVPLTIFFPHSFVTYASFKFLYSILIILCTFPYRHFLQTIKTLFLFYFVTFTIGGGLIATQYLLKDSLFTHENGFMQVDDFKVNIVLLSVGFPLIWLFTKQGMDSHLAEKINYDQLYDITIEFDEVYYKTTAFIDSGNHLVDPLTRHPVILCDEHFIAQFFSEKVWHKFKHVIECNDVSNLPDELMKRVQLIPYEGAAGVGGFLYAIKPDLLIVHYGDEVITTKNIYIGIRLGSFSVNHRYHCLLHPKIIYEFVA